MPVRPKSTTTPGASTAKKPVPEQTSVDTTDAPHRKPGISNPDKPKLPHERDESVDAPADTPDPVVQQGARDLGRGLQDTDRGPEADRTYQKLKK